MENEMFTATYVSRYHASASEHRSMIIEMVEGIENEKLLQFIFDLLVSLKKRGGI